MGFIFLISNTYIIVTFLIVTGNIIQIPHLFRAFAPTYYLIGPLLLFYFRGAVFNKVIVWNKDWPHFLPALIQFIDLIPFYLKPSFEKREILERILVDSRLTDFEGSGFLDAEIHSILRLVFLFAYLVYLLICLFKSRRRIHQFQNGKSFFQLLFLTLVVFLLGVINSSIYLINSFYSDLPTSLSSSSFPYFVLVGSSFVVYLFLHGFIFFMPETTFSLPDPSKLKKYDMLKKDTAEVTEPIETKKELELSASILSKLEIGMRVEKWFQINGLTVEECAKKLECERYILSKLINGHYKMRFNDYVNFHRVEFVKNEIKKGSTKKITLEGLSEEAGFNSRTTFYNAFIKHEGLSPQEYLKRS